MTTIGLPTKILALFLALLLALPSAAVAPSTPQLPDPGTTGMTKEQQIQAGRQVAAEVYKQMPVLPDSSPETQYIQQLGRKLVAVIPSQYSWPYEFHVIPQKDINAFAVPGGPMFVNVGTIVSADNEAELVGVMAHEMSHVYMQHSAKQASKAQWTNMLGALGGLFGSGVGGSLARLGIQLGAGTLMMRYSRGDEAQADAVGAIIMYKAGYNPRALADFFEKLAAQGGGSGPQFLSDHPNPGNRRAAIDREIKDWPRKTFTADSQAFVSTKRHATTIPTYTAQQIADQGKQGIWDRQNRQSGATPASAGAGTSSASGTAGIANVSFEQVRPSGNMTSLQQDAFTISYPANWRAFVGQQANVTVAPPAGVEQGTIAYGVVIAGAQNSNGTSLDEATSSLVSNLQQSNSGLRPTGNLQRLQVGGQPADAVNLVGASPVQRNGSQVSERDWLVTFQRQDGSLFYLIFIAPEGDFERLRPTYQNMLNSLEIR